MTFVLCFHTSVVKNRNIYIVQIIGKEKKQSSVSDADREIVTLGSTDNAGNSVNFDFCIFSLLSGWDFSVCIGDR